MARIEFQDNLEEQISQLEGLRRDAVKRIVMAGADACAEAEKQAIGNTIMWVKRAACGKTCGPALIMNPWAAAA
jgi:hypothetical protein